MAGATDKLWTMQVALREYPNIILKIRLCQANSSYHFYPHIHGSVLKLLGVTANPGTTRNTLFDVALSLKHIRLLTFLMDKLHIRHTDQYKTTDEKKPPIWWFLS